MITKELLDSVDKANPEKSTEQLSPEDIAELINLLNEKDDKLRYPAFLALIGRSMHHGDVYPYFDRFAEKLKSGNSFQRSIGLMLIAENAKWDSENKFEKIFDEYMACVNDEKPITARQCIQSLKKVVPYKKALHNRISKRLMQLNLDTVRETMKKLVLTDILDVLMEIRKCGSDEAIEEYISKALSGGILDKKAKKTILGLM